MKPPFVCLAATSARPTHDWSFGQRAVEILLAADPALRPERIGRDETEMRKKLPCATAEDLRPLWATGRGMGQIVGGLPHGAVDALLWKRARPLRCEGSFGQTWVNLKGAILPGWVRLKCRYAAAIDFGALFRDFCGLYEPDQAYLHLFTEPELPNPPHVQVTYEQIQARTVPQEWIDHDNWATFRMGLFGALSDQKRYNLGAVNWFPARMLGADLRKALQAAGISVEPSGAGFLVQICGLDEVASDFATFSRRRALAKRLIGPELFEIRDEPA